MSSPRLLFRHEFNDIANLYDILGTLDITLVTVVFAALRLLLRARAETTLRYDACGLDFLVSAAPGI